ncbi:putative non-ribosomal peptide synthase domain protein [Burkholderia mallei]|nr:putative non-ribosomal peptide synthase domain protein [Burkholderia mallei]
MNNSLNITTGSSAGRPLSAQYRCATFARMNSKSTAASIWRSRWSFGTSSSSVTISSSCCVGMGVFSITPLKNKNPHLARVCQQSEAEGDALRFIGCRARREAVAPARVTPATRRCPARPCYRRRPLRRPSFSRRDSRAPPPP